jgi:capsular exopolysaccharide synthesis family protein
MSRVDQALRISERDSGVLRSEPGASSPSNSNSLGQYPQETPISNATAKSNDRPAVQVALARPTLSGDDASARLVTGAVSSVPLEQYRRLAAVLHEEQIHSQLKTVMITSAVPQEGKTLTTVNLALTLSESYERRVLVIDADLRWPSLHTVLNIPNDRGLSEAIGDGRQVLPITVVSSRLSALTAGHPGSTPLASLTSQRMAEILDECAARFDWVLMDTSPVGVLPDAQVLTRLVGGVVFVIGAGMTPAADIEQAIADLGADSIIGVVLNRVEERRIREAGYYNQYGYSARTR